MYRLNLECFDVASRLPDRVLNSREDTHTMTIYQFMMLAITLYYTYEFSRVLRLRALRGQRLRQLMSDRFQLTGRF